jgi:hypothetical protein
MMYPTVRKSFSPRGEAPVNKVSDPHGRISTIGAIAISPGRDQLTWHHCSRAAQPRDCRSNDRHLGPDHHSLLWGGPRVSGGNHTDKVGAVPHLRPQAEPGGQGLVLH